MTTKNNARPTIHIKIDPTTLAELHALAARDRTTMTRWIITTVAETFRKLPKTEKERWYTPPAPDPNALVPEHIYQANKKHEQESDR
jgi:hypothetical protein